jgi:hypothetical protein
MRTVSFTEGTGLQTIDTSHIHLTHLATHIIVTHITNRMVIRHITLLTLTCIKMRKEFMKVLILESEILLIFEMSMTVRGKLK